MIFAFSFIEILLNFEKSSIVNESYQDNFKPVYFFFFEEKISRTQKHVTSKNQLTKQKSANTKQQRQQFFTRV